MMQGYMFLASLCPLLVMESDEWTVGCFGTVAKMWNLLTVVGSKGRVRQRFGCLQQGGCCAHWANPLPPGREETEWGHWVQFLLQYTVPFVLLHPAKLQAIPWHSHGGRWVIFTLPIAFLKVTSIGRPAGKWKSFPFPLLFCLSGVIPFLCLGKDLWKDDPMGHRLSSLFCNCLLARF